MNETIELERRLRDAIGLGLDAVVMNAMWPERFSSSDVTKLRAAARDGHDESELGAVRAALAVHERVKAQRAHLRRLGARARRADQHAAVRLRVRAGPGRLRAARGRARGRDGRARRRLSPAGPLGVGAPAARVLGRRGRDRRGRGANVDAGGALLWAVPLAVLVLAVTARAGAALAPLAVGHPRRGDRHPARHARGQPHARALGAGAARGHAARRLRADCSGSRRSWCTPPPAATRSRCCLRATPSSCANGSPGSRARTTMTEPRRLHRAAVVVYSADALRSAAFPLIVIVGMSVLGGGGFDARDLMRAAVYGAIGVTVSAVMGYLRWRTTTYRIGAEAIHHHTGIISSKDTDVPLARIEALDVHQGPLQRRSACSPSTCRPARRARAARSRCRRLTPEAVEELRAAPAAGGGRGRGAEPAHSAGSRGRELAVAALTAGPARCPAPGAGGRRPGALAGARGGARRGGGAAAPALVAAVLIGAVALLAAAWLLSIARRGRRLRRLHVTRDGDRLRIRRGLVSRNEATVPVGRVRAVRVVEGVLRRPFGLARADGRGHRLRRGGLGGAHAVPAGPDARGARRSWTSSCPSWRTTSTGSSAHRHAPRGATCSCRRSSGVAVSAGVVPGRPVRAARAADRRSTATRAGAPLGGGCATAGWRSARCCSPARRCWPRRGSGSRTRWRRTCSSGGRGWPTCRVAFGKSTTARCGTWTRVPRVGLGRAVAPANCAVRECRSLPSRAPRGWAS